MNAERNFVGSFVFTVWYDDIKCTFSHPIAQSCLLSHPSSSTKAIVWKQNVMVTAFTAP